MGSKMIHLQTSEQLTQLLNENKFVVLDFSATWCGPCKKLTPALEKLENEFKKQVIFIKIDVDELEEIAKNYNVTAMPTIIFYKNGKLLPEMVIGANFAKIDEIIKANL